MSADGALRRRLAVRLTVFPGVWERGYFRWFSDARSLPWTSAWTPVSPRADLRRGRGFYLLTLFIVTAA